eukprot:5219296-Prymnesium_polylepis.1
MCVCSTRVSSLAGGLSCLPAVRQCILSPTVSRLCAPARANSYSEPTGECDEIHVPIMAQGGRSGSRDCVPMHLYECLAVTYMHASVAQAKYLP